MLLIDKMTIRKFNNFLHPIEHQMIGYPLILRVLTIIQMIRFADSSLLIVYGMIFAKCMLKIFKKNYYSSSNFNIPILIISGKNDAANAGSKYAQKLYLFLNKIFKSVQLIILNDTRHEVFTDIQKDISYNHLKEFITK